MSGLIVRKRSLFRADISLNTPTQFVNINNVAKYPFLGKFLKKRGYASELTINQNGALKKIFVNTKSFIKHINKTQIQNHLPVTHLTAQDFKEIDLTKIQAIFNQTAPEQNLPTQGHLQRSLELINEPRISESSVKTDGLKALPPLRAPRSISPSLKKNDEPVIENEMHADLNDAPTPSTSSSSAMQPITIEAQPSTSSIQVQFTFPNGNLYKGELDEFGKPHGIGEESNALGLVYKGSYLNGLREGSGEEYMHGKVSYKGNFLADLRSGRGQEYTVKEYTINVTNTRAAYSILIYEGDFVAGKREGIGKEFEYDRVTYEGNYKAGKRSGYGVEHKIRSRWCNVTKSFFDIHSLFYKGDYVDGLQEGQGKEYESNEVIYDGGFKAGLRHGKGTLTAPNGDTYVGEMINGKKEGQGVFTFAEDFIHERLCFEGTFANDSFVKGVCKYKNGTVYEGAMINGKKNGQGTLTSTNTTETVTVTEIETGIWKDDKLSKGTITSKSLVDNELVTIVTEYANGQKHGAETTTYSSLGKHVVNYAEGLMHGKNLLYTSDGELYLKEMYQQGQLLRKCKGRFNQDEFLHGVGQLFDYTKGVTYWGIFENGKMTSALGVFRTTDEEKVSEQIYKIQDEESRRFFEEYLRFDEQQSQNDPKTSGDSTLDSNIKQFTAQNAVQKMKKIFDIYMEHLKNNNIEPADNHKFDMNLFNAKNAMEIKVLYRKLAHSFHPDRNAASKEMAEKFFKKLQKIHALFLKFNP